MCIVYCEKNIHKKEGEGERERERDERERERRMRRTVKVFPDHNNRVCIVLSLSIETNDILMSKFVNGIKSHTHTCTHKL